LQLAIEKWEKQKKTQTLIKKLYAKYWHTNYQLAKTQIRMPKGRMSPYDASFKEYADLVGWDWRLVAALAYNESRYNPDLVSWAGAVGVMQLMPVTARKMGLSDEEFFLPAPNIRAGTKYLKRLDNSFSRAVPDQQERIKFILAAYNAGPAHIWDAIALAQKYGKNSAQWKDVEYFLIKKYEPQYYNDPVVRYGPYRGASAAGFVKKVLAVYEENCN